jgi:hypothetical protein
MAYELEQYKKHVLRNKQAEAQRDARRHSKNGILQRGGILKVADGRDMVRQAEEDDEKKAEKVVLAMRKREKMQMKKMHEEAAKLGRKLRLEGKLGPLEVYEIGKPVRYVKRG